MSWGRAEGVVSGGECGGVGGCHHDHHHHHHRRRCWHHHHHHHFEEISKHAALTPPFSVQLGSTIIDINPPSLHPSTSNV